MSTSKIRLFYGLPEKDPKHIKNLKNLVYFSYLAMFNKTSKDNAKLGLVTSFNHCYLLMTSIPGTVSNMNFFSFEFIHIRELIYNT